MSEEKDNELSITVSLKSPVGDTSKDESKGASRREKDKKRLKDWAREFVEENHEEIAELAKR
jgi:hypothetical protein